MTAIKHGRGIARKTGRKTGPEIGIIGLGRMGMNMARRLMRGGHRVAVYNRTPKKVKDMQREGAVGAFTLEELIATLRAPRVVWIMLPAGGPADEAIGALKGLLNKGDIIVEGGNSHYADDVRRASELAPMGINYMDVGVSGGIWGLKEGYCLMAGGEEKTYKKLLPFFKTLAPKDGYLYCGPAGAGHFVKMVHNAIEYGMMSAYAEGFDIMQASPYAGSLDLQRVAHLWNRGSVVRSWLLELAEEALRKDKDLSSIEGYVEDSGEGRWGVKEAIDSAVPAPVIAAALFQRFRSRKGDSFADRMLAALRAEFGGHEVRKRK